MIGGEFSVGKQRPSGPGLPDVFLNPTLAGARERVLRAPWENGPGRAARETFALWSLSISGERSFRCDVAEGFFFCLVYNKTEPSKCFLFQRL